LYQYPSLVGISDEIKKFPRLYDENERKILVSQLETYFTMKKEQLRIENPGSKIKAYFKKNDFYTNNSITEFIKTYMTHNLRHRAKDNISHT
jgi:hypothetical protein